MSCLQPLIGARSRPRFCRPGAQVKHTEADRQSENRDQLHSFVHRKPLAATIEYEGPTSFAPEARASWLFQPPEPGLPASGIVDQVNFIYPGAVSTNSPYGGATLTFNG